MAITSLAISLASSPKSRGRDLPRLHLGINPATPTAKCGRHAKQIILPLIAGARTDGAVWPDAEEIDWSGSFKTADRWRGRM